jgi:hypothetical protein
MNLYSFSIAFALFTTGAVIFWLLNRYLSKVRARPVFVIGRTVIRGRYAIAPKEDYAAAKAAGEGINGLVRVRRTMVLAKYPGDPGDIGSLSIAMSRVPCEFEFVWDLFTPFVSEGLMSFNEQYGFFMQQPEDPYEFVKEILDEDPIRGIAFLDEGSDGKTVTGRIRDYCCYLLIATLMVFIAEPSFTKAGPYYEYLHFPTEQGVKGVEFNKDNYQKHLVLDWGDDGKKIIGGKVTEITEISTGLVHACITTAKGSILCGHAPTSTKVGEKMYQRFLRVCMYRNEGNGMCGVYDYFPHLMSKKDTDMLRTVRGYNITD